MKLHDVLRWFTVICGVQCHLKRNSEVLLSCRRSGLSHAGHEQQLHTSAQPERPEPVSRSALQHSQLWLFAHTAVAEQVRRRRVSCFCVQTGSNKRVFFCPQRHPAHEQPQRPEPQPAGGGADGANQRDGRREGGRRREERQHGQPQPLVSQHHRDAQTAAGAAAVHHQQVTMTSSRHHHG